MELRPVARAAALEARTRPAPEGEAIQSRRAGRIGSPAKQHSALPSAMAVAEVADLVVVTHHAIVLTLHGHADVLRQRFL
jgi:hypothetical protein